MKAGIQKGPVSKYCKKTVCIQAKLLFSLALISGFHSMTQVRVFLFPLVGILFHRTIIPSSKFAGTHLYTWVERGAVKVRCLPRNTTQCPQPGLKPGLLVPELSPLAMRPPHSNSSFRQIIAKHDNKVEEAYRASLSRGIQRLSLVPILTPGWREVL